MTDIPAVSILMPSLNVAPYIRQCMDSVVGQTLQNIEILCIDAGSTDGTLEALEEYARADHRVKLIHSDKKSYGYQMNLGLDAARGEYIGIVETDDWAEPHMFETLWRAATAHGADMVRANYFWYYTEGGRDIPFENHTRCPHGRLFAPVDKPRVFAATPSIWSGIYRREMLTANHIRFNETPGASYQDLSFHLMTCTASRRCWLLRDYLLHYRQDNENSSVHAPGKVYCVREEMDYYAAFLDARPDDKAALEGLSWALRHDKYRWNYYRLAPQYQWEFLMAAHQEFSAAQEMGLLDKSCFSGPDWHELQALLRDPKGYFDRTAKPLPPAPPPQVEPPYLIRPAAHRWVGERPQVSVVVPVYDTERYLTQCLDSILTQSLADIEVICVDDGSPDDSAAILEDYAQRDDRVTLVRQKNAGLSAARNAGLDQARGEYLLFVDSDDALAPGALEALYRRCREDALDGVYFDARCVYEDSDTEKRYRGEAPYYCRPARVEGVCTGPQLMAQLRRAGAYRAPAYLQMLSLDFVRRTGIRFYPGIIYEDNPFTFSVMLQMERCTKVDESYYLRLFRSGSIVTSAEGFRNLYGYLKSYQLMEFAALGAPQDPSCQRAMDMILADIANHVRRICAALDGGERDKRQDLDQAEGRLLDRILATAPPPQRGGKLVQALTFVPRKLWGGVRCLREHGTRYTLRRVSEKLGRLFWR